MCRWVGVFTIALMLVGCSPYRVTVEQGNFLEARVSTQVHLGMSRAAVIELLGTPVLDDIFEQDRLTYIYTKKEHRKRLIRSRLVLEFKQDKLVRIIRS